MMPTLKAEFRKLLTVRSTYIITGISLLLLVFVGLYVEGYRNGAESVAGMGGSLFLAGSVTQHSTLLSVFASIVALLLLTHEYRYNTIMYTLTSANRRSKVLAAKVITVFVYVLALVIVGGALGLGCMMFGLHLAGQSLPPQNISLVTYFGKMLFFCEGWGMAALLLAALLRNQVAALAVLFIAPNTVEGLLSLLLKQNAKYLPFNALQQVISAPTVPGARAAHDFVDASYLSPLKGALLFGAYLLAGWIVAWVLFLYRDAN
jgi:ABC-2 type transport system permease protein